VSEIWGTLCGLTTSRVRSGPLREVRPDTLNSRTGQELKEQDHAVQDYIQAGDCERRPKNRPAPLITQLKLDQAGHIGVLSWNQHPLPVASHSLSSCHRRECRVRKDPTLGVPIPSSHRANSPPRVHPLRDKKEASSTQDDALPSLSEFPWLVGRFYPFHGQSLPPILTLIPFRSSEAFSGAEGHIPLCGSRGRGKYLQICTCACVPPPPLFKAYPPHSQCLGELSFAVIIEVKIGHAVTIVQACIGGGQR